MLAARYELRRDGEVVGTVAERGGLTRRRELRLQFPDTLAAPIQIFLLFLVCDRSYR
jgi:hypothetical protein